MALNIDEFYAELEAFGRDEVKLRLAQGIYNERVGEKGSLAREWLRRKDQEAEHAAEARREASQAEQAATAARAVESAERAAEATERQATTAEKATRIAVAALVIAIISGIASMVSLFRSH